MPESEIRKRGGVIRWRTIHPKGHPDEYLHIAVVRKKGKLGGRTIAGKLKHDKKMYA